MEIRVHFLANRTTRVEIRDGKRFFGDREDKSQAPTHAMILGEIGDASVKLEIPPRMCSKGHRLEVELEFMLTDQATRFRAEGIAQEVEVLPHDHDNITIQFTKYDTRVWKKFLRQNQTRQASIADLFKRLKGN